MIDMVIKGFNYEPCEIAMNIALRNYNKHKKKICGFRKIYSRQDKGNYSECGISKIKGNTKEIQIEVRRRIKIITGNKVQARKKRETNQIKGGYNG